MEVILEKGMDHVMSMHRVDAKWKCRESAVIKSVTIDKLFSPGEVGPLPSLNCADSVRKGRARPPSNGVTAPPQAQPPADIDDNLNDITSQVTDHYIPT